MLGRATAYAKDHPEIAVKVLVPFESTGGNLASYSTTAGISTLFAAIPTLVGGGAEIALGVGAGLAAGGVTAVALGPACGIGIAVGLATFEAVVIATNIQKIRNSDHYKAWKALRISLMEDQTLQEFIEKDPLLIHFLKLFLV